MNANPMDQQSGVAVQRLLTVLLNPWFLAGATAIILVGVSLALAGPLDETIWGYSTWLWAVHGEPPYVGAFENKPAGIFLLYRLCYAIFGHTLWPVRIFGLSATIGTLLLIYLLGRSYHGKTTGAIAALLFGLAAASHVTDGSVLATTEAFMGVFSTVAFALLSLVYWKGPQRRAWPCLLGVGVAFGAALTFKQIALADVIGLVPMYWVARGRNKSIAVILCDVLLMVVAGSAIVALSFVPLWLSGVTTHEYFDAVWGVLLFQAGQLPLLSRLRLFTSTWTNGPLMTFYPLLLLYLFQKHRLRCAGIPFWSLLFWGFMDFVAANASNLFPHHIKPLLIPLSLAGGLAIGVSIQAMNFRSLKWLLWTYLSIVALMFPTNSLVVGIARLLHLSESTCNEIREQRSYQLAADYVRSHTGPSDCVCIWALNSHPILWYAQRRSSCRYFNALFRFAPDFESATQADLTARPPKLILINVPNNSRLPAPACISRLLARDYAPAGRVDDFEVFQRAVAGGK